MTPAQLDELERHAAAGGVCTLEASELLELVQGHRCLLAFSELVGSMRSMLQAHTLAHASRRNEMECKLCTRLRAIGLEYCERHRGGLPVEGD